MLSAEDNVKLTRVGKDTPLGKLLRRYWIPALLSSEVPEPDGRPVRVKVLGEKLIAYRDTEGKVGILDEFCPHRRTSLYFGRNEECGLRCVYHGWKFDREGNCLDMPSEPPESKFKDTMKIPAFPTYEAGGFVWVYLGEQDQMPPVPDFVWTHLPDNQRMTAKVLYDCNFLQAFENEIDLVHAAFLHRRLHDHEGEGTGRTNNGLSPSHPLVKNAPPKQEIDYTAYGFRNIGTVSLSEEELAINVHPVVMPFYSFTPRMAGEDMLFHGYVPRDDYTTWNFEVHFNPDRPIDAEKTIDWRGLWVDETFQKVRNISNDYMIDHDLMKNSNYSGILGVSNQDAAVIESMGPIVDRSLEKLGTSDLPIIAYRRMLLKSLEQMEQGGAPVGLEQDYPYKQIFSRGAIVPKGISWKEACPLDPALERKELHVK